MRADIVKAVFESQNPDYTLAHECVTHTWCSKKLVLRWQVLKDEKNVGWVAGDLGSKVSRCFISEPILNLHGQSPISLLSMISLEDKI